MRKQKKGERSEKGEGGGTGARGEGGWQWYFSSVKLKLKSDPQIHPIRIKKNFNSSVVVCFLPLFISVLSVCTDSEEDQLLLHFVVLPGLCLSSPSLWGRAFVSQPPWPTPSPHPPAADTKEKRYFTSNPNKYEFYYESSNSSRFYLGTLRCVQNLLLLLQVPGDDHGHVDRIFLEPILQRQSLYI